MRILIKQLTAADRLKSKFGIFNIILKFEDRYVMIKRGSLSAIFGLKFYPRLNYSEECLAYIGDFCEFADTHLILGGEHPNKIIANTFGTSYEIMLTQDSPQFMPTSKGPIVIEPCCIFGVKTTILSGVHLGRNSIVGAGTLLTKIYPENSIVVGVPGYVKAQRLSQGEIKILDEYPWWEASYDWIIRSIGSLQAGEIPEFEFTKNKDSEVFLCLRVKLEDAIIKSWEIEGIRIDENYIGKHNFPKKFMNYLSSFDGAGSVEIDTNIIDKCFR